MNKFRNLILVTVIALFTYSCVDDPKSPTIEGIWEVKEVIAQGQVNIPDDAFDVESTLHLDPNETFLFINIDGRATGGTWTYDDNSLVLTGNDGVVQNFTLMHYDWEKLHIFRTFTLATGEEIELRYLFKRLKQFN